MLTCRLRCLSDATDSSPVCGPDHLIRQPLRRRIPVVNPLRHTPQEDAVALAVHVVIRGVTREQYDAVRAADGWLDNPPAGGISHLTWWEGNDCHNVDAWESEANFEAFAATRLGPAMATAGVTNEPEITMYEAHEAFVPAARIIAPTAPVNLSGSDDLRTLRDAYAAFATGDMATVFAAFDDGIVWETPASIQFGGTYKGHAGVREFFGHL